MLNETLPAEGLDDIKGIVENRMEAPLVLDHMVAGTDEGFNYKDQNEDGCVVVEEKKAGAVVDAMGDYANGVQAKECATAALVEGLAQGKPFKVIQGDMHKRMAAAGLTADGVTYAAFRLDPATNELEYGLAGDSGFIITQDREVIFKTTPEHWQLEDLQAALAEGRISEADVDTWLEGKPRTEENLRALAAEFVSNCVTGNSEGRTTAGRVQAKPGDRIIAYTDGVGDNLTPEEIAELARGKSAEEAFKAIADAVEDKMKSGEGKPDNRTLLILDVGVLE